MLAIAGLGRRRREGIERLEHAAESGVRAGRARVHVRLAMLGELLELALERRELLVEL